jgi:NADH-quinone oxidoreductase subunit M
MVLVAAFTLRALKQSFFGDSGATSTTESHQHEKLPPITWPEKCGACLLMFATLAIGLYPRLLLDRIQPAVEAMRFLKP